MDDGVSVELVHCGDDALLEFLFRCDADVVSIGVQKSDPLRRGIGVQNLTRRDRFGRTGSATILSLEAAGFSVSLSAAERKKRGDDRRLVFAKLCLNLPAFTRPSPRRLRQSRVPGGEDAQTAGPACRPHDRLWRGRQRNDQSRAHVDRRLRRRLLISRSRLADRRSGDG